MPFAARRIWRLDQLGFVWSRQEHAWETHFQELKAFKKRHGHCNVSSRSKTDALLGNWVYSQHRLRKLGKLSEERIRRLEALGIQWRIR